MTTERFWPARRPARTAGSWPVCHRRSALREPVGPRLSPEYRAAVHPARALCRACRALPSPPRPTPLTRADIVERLQLQGARCSSAALTGPTSATALKRKKEPLEQLLRFIEREHPGMRAWSIASRASGGGRAGAGTAKTRGVQALPYHASLPAETRQAHQTASLREDGIVVVATIAFGMGIDKPDVRFVAHVDMPKTSRATTKKPAAPGAMVCQRTPGWSMACKTW